MEILGEMEMDGGLSVRTKAHAFCDGGKKTFK